MKMAPLLGAWGTQRFGLADYAVLAALEGLLGTEACSGYSSWRSAGPGKPRLGA